MSVLCAVIVAISSLHRANSQCYSFMGISTCKKTADIELRFPFTPAWWVTNVYHRFDEIRDAKRALQQTPVWILVGSFRNLGEMANILDSEMFERMIRQVIQYFADKGEVVELLADPDVTYRDLYISFRANSEEMLKVYDELLDVQYWDKDIHDFFNERRHRLTRMIRILAFLPSEIIMPYVKLMDRRMPISSIDVKSEIPQSSLSMKIVKAAVDAYSGRSTS